MTLRAGTYDFRRAGDPTYNDAAYRRLAGLVEETFLLANHSKVHLLAHSLGCPFSNRFLKLQPAWWRGKYVASLVQIAAPTAGTPVALAGIIVSRV